MQKACARPGRATWRTKGAHVEYLWLPDTDDKTGLDDYLVEHTVEDLWRLVKPVQPTPTDQPDNPAHRRRAAETEPVATDPPGTRRTTVFHRWLGEDYDTDALDAVLAAAAVEKLDDGRPGVAADHLRSGNAKTETVQALDGVGAIVTSSIIVEAALLSATPKRERAKDATGGLLRQIGDRGLLVVKDVTSILSMNRDTRAKVLAALREIYDGRWYREVGTDGGRTLEWEGRIVVIGAVTTAWDTHHGVIATMGDRFTLVRIDSTKARQARRARRPSRNTGDEAQMRSELAAAVAGRHRRDEHRRRSRSPTTRPTRCCAAADLVTLARTGVEYDYRGDVIDAHAPEMPTRFAKQLTQIVRGGRRDRHEPRRRAAAGDPLRARLDAAAAAGASSTTCRASTRDSTTGGAQAAREATRHRRPPAPGAAHARRARPSMRRSSPEASRGTTHSPTTSTPVPLSSHQKCYQKSHHTPLAPMKRVKEARARTERGEGTSGVCTDFSGNGSTSTSPPPPRSTPPTDGHAAYRNGLCKTCHVVPYRPGGTQCEDCFQADRDALNLVIGHLGATPVDPQESAS